ncbi:hypothetical protein DRJ48_01800 [Candidatus Woesearchaeota archaeon]|nr:hypothetical protein [Candidatus Woesearchaeota archaeon]RLE43125.1 MAG: hypothetical protein DRJ48_01800 [Candidatus Woesearchaeota archaeon]
MRIDVVLPKGNESEFYQQALSLGYEGLVLLYPIERLKGLKLPKPPQNLKVTPAGLIDAKRISRRAPKKLLTFIEGGKRHEFEKICPNVIFNLEQSKKPDKTHYRSSGLDDVLCRIAHKAGIIVGFGLNRILNSAIPRHVVLGRIMQNIRFCRRFDVEMLLGSFANQPLGMRSAHDMIAFGMSLGMSSIEAKQSIEVLTRFFI